MKPPRSASPPPEKSLPPELGAGLRLYQSGLHQEAERIFRQFQQKRPGDADALHLCGVAIQAQGRLDEAADYFSRAVAKNGKRATYWVNWALCLAAGGHVAQAIQKLEMATRLKPDFVEAWYNLGVLQRQANQVEAAVASYRKVLRLSPHHLSALNNLGDMLSQMGQRTEAIALLQHALALRPDFTDAQYNLACLMVDEAPAETIPLLRQVIQACPGLGDAYRLCAKALSKNAEHAAAVTMLELALRQTQDSADIRNDLGLVYLEMGDLPRARQEFETAISLCPDHGHALYNLAFAVKADAQPVLLAKLDAAISTPGVADDIQVLLHFASGHLHESAQNYDRAFSHFEQANRLKHAQYQPEEIEAQFAALRAVFTRDFYSASPLGSDDPLPVIIVGMPRSGTTLVEQIIASHPQAAGAGELLMFNQMANGLGALLKTAEPYPDNVRLLTTVQREQLAKHYLAELKRRGGEDKNRISDKMPGNFVNLGLIAWLFPRAKIIHCRRDPLDTCLSCFATNFTGHLPFTYSLESLAHYYRQYQALMAHWEMVLPTPIYTVTYETLVTSPDTEIPQLIEFIGLPWDARCQSPHQTQRAVSTASNVQIRQPIYQKSVRRADRFARHLLPLKAGLQLA